MSKSDQITRNQHYVSRGIQKQFADTKNKVYELFIEKDNLSKKNYNKTMAQNFVYEHPKLSTNYLEKLFSDIEDVYIPKIDSCIAKIEKENLSGINYSQFILRVKEMLPIFMIFYFRSGALLYEYSFSSENPKLDRVERMILNIFNGRYLWGLCETISKFYESAVIVDEKERFLLSDQYISTVALSYKNKFSNASNRQIGMKDTMILLPLSAKYYVVFYHGKKPNYISKEKFCVLDDIDVAEINNVIYQNSYVKCIAKKQEAFDMLEKITLYSPTKTMMLYNDGTVKDYVSKREVFLYKNDRDMNENSIHYIDDYILKIKGKVGRNSKCICGSGKKYKQCCMGKYEEVKKIIYGVENQDRDLYTIPNVRMAEDAIEIFIGKEEGLNESDKLILDRVRGIIQI